MARRRRSSPYKFLDSYGVRDRDRFFGRDLETDLLVADVVVSRIVVLFAKTGTGKTSLINAGVRPRLRERGYRTYLIRVREDPFVSARAALREQAPKSFPQDGSLAEQLRGLAANVKAPVVLFFDQFEEFFLYTVNRNVTAATEFVGAIGDVYDDPDSGVHVVFSMREEWFVDMGFFRDRIPAIFHNDSNLRLRWFDRTQARDAIVRPAGENAYERALVDVLVDELAATSRAVAPTPLPGDIEPAQLQIVCDTLWRRAANGTITVGDYRALGDDERADSVAQQILDRRLVEEFEDLDRAQLELLAALLPELRTPEGTKRVREYQDLVGSLLSKPGIVTEAGAIRELLERLQRDRLLDILPRESGEIVELTHDYLVMRLDELGVQIALIWPRRILSEGTKAFRARGELLHSSVVRDVVAAASALDLDAVRGELLLRSALGHLLDVAPIMPALLHSDAPVWRIFAERVLGGPDAERSRAVETLVALDVPDAYAVLRDALGSEETAPHVLRLLGRAHTAGAVELLEHALGRPDLAPQAEAALADLASAPGDATIGARAHGLLRKTLTERLADLNQAAAAIDWIVRLDTPVSVELLEEALDRPHLGDNARKALLELAGSTDLSVAALATKALVERVERSLADGAPEPWCVETLEAIARPAAVELLGRLVEHPARAAEARDALERLQRSPRADVAAAATRELDRGVVVVPERPTEEEPPEPVDTRAVPVSFEEHFDSVLRLLSNARLVPFLGNGSTTVDRPPGGSWEQGMYPPTGPELARHLAERFAYPEGEPTDLQHVAEYAEIVAGRRPLYDELRAVFARPYPPTALHAFLARLPKLFRNRTGSTQMVVTTTLDDRLERAFAEAGEPFDVVGYLSGPRRGKFVHRPPDGSPIVIEDPQTYAGIRPEERTVILRLNGGVDLNDASGDSFVVTEEDHVESALHFGSGQNAFPVTLLAALMRSSLLFLGYGLREWNVRILLNTLWRDPSQSRSKSWAVLENPSKLDVELWRRRDIELLDMPLGDYVSELERRLFEFDVGAVPA